MAPASSSKMSFADAVQVGIKRHREGNYDGAAKVYEQLLEVNPESEDVLQLMGLICVQTGDPIKGIELMQKSISVNPNNPTVHCNLGGALKRAGRMDEAVESYLRATAIDPNMVDGHFNLGVLHKEADRFNQAAEHFKATLKLAPDHTKAQYMLAAITDKSTKMPPAGFVRDVFDEHSHVFEASMDHGSSRIPELVRDAALQHLGRQQMPQGKSFPAILDLGCGTGRSGVPFRAFCNTLHGVDLSPNMMEYARAKNIYDDLYLDDFVNFMAAAKSEYDLVLSVDAFLYMGPLDDVFANVARLLKAGGSFGFTVEALDEGDYALQPTCRHAQSETYIRRLADEYGFNVEICEHVPKLRYDVKGTLFWLVKPE